MRRTPPESRGEASAPTTAGRQLARKRRDSSRERRVRGSRGDRYPPGGKGGGVNLSRSLEVEAGARETSAIDRLNSVAESDSSSQGLGGWESGEEVVGASDVEEKDSSPLQRGQQLAPHATPAHAHALAHDVMPVIVDVKGLDAYDDDTDDDCVVGMQDSNIVWGNDVNKNCEAILEFCEANGCSRDSQYSRAQHAMNQRNGLISLLDDQAEMVADFLRVMKTNNRVPATVEPIRPIKAWNVTTTNVDTIGDLDIIGADGVVIADPVANVDNIVLQPASIAHICDVLGEEFHKRHHVSSAKTRLHAFQQGPGLGEISSWQIPSPCSRSGVSRQR